jgi:para-nitrobenzyl esterase
LSLNIFRPLRGGPLRPVLVFFFGGSFKNGSAGLGKSPFGPDYDGAQIAGRTGAIVVTVNYRLGTLGFLALPALDAEDPRHVSGNYGLLDQRAALRWIQGNALLLGADPNRVTLLGQSAGAVSILEHMVSAQARGLFSGAELESPGALPTATLQELEALDAPIVTADGALSTAMEQQPGFDPLRPILRQFVNQPYG